MNLFILLIDIILVIMTYLKSSSLISTGVAVVLTLVGYLLIQNKSKPIWHAIGVFSVALIAGFIFFFGAFVKFLASTISSEALPDMKVGIHELGEKLTVGSTPPFNLSGDGPTDLTLFVFGFALIQIILPMLFNITKRIATLVLR
jgi:hypothetical protein